MHNVGDDAELETEHEPAGELSAPTTGLQVGATGLQIQTVASSCSCTVYGAGSFET